jgi:pyruvate dehydrogenase E2 component (dihydrolipoamide acetyltransferase)
MGMTMEEGTVIRWQVQPGQAVTEGQVLLEVETDKVMLQVPAPADGVLGSHLVKENQRVPVGTTLCYLHQDGESDNAATTPGAPSVQKEDKATSIVEPTVRPQDERIRATPRARRLASELGIDLVSLVKSDERITEDDVRAAANARTATTPELESVSSIRKLIAERMTFSFQNVPHFYLTVECDAANLLAWRDVLLSKTEQERGASMTMTDLLVKLVAQTLAEFPLVNASWTDKGIQKHPQVNIGIATDTPDGLIVPVIKEAERKSISEIAQARQTLVTRARSRSLGPDDVQGSSFTLTNLGMHSVDAVNAIINPPESAILGVGQIKKRPVVIEDSILVRPTVVLTLSGDHRVFDGAMGARFLSRLVEFIENPLSIR